MWIVVSFRIPWSAVVKEATEDPSRNTCVAPHVGECWPGLEPWTHQLKFVGNLATYRPVVSRDWAVGPARGTHSVRGSAGCCFRWGPCGRPFRPSRHAPVRAPGAPHRPAPAIACVMLAYPCHLRCEMTKLPFVLMINNNAANESNSWKLGDCTCLVPCSNHAEEIVRCTPIAASCLVLPIIPF